MLAALVRDLHKPFQLRFGETGTVAYLFCANVNPQAGGEIVGVARMALQLSLDAFC